MIRRQITVFGTVQGVGFRPFIYRLAREIGLRGRVYNDKNGVQIEVEGAREKVEFFEQQIVMQKPQLSTITDIISAEIPLQNEIDFVITHSEQSEQIFTHIPPDTALCPSCAQELFDPNNRRYLHPFISCTNCGARFTIIDSLPYDRPYTSMRDFAMCETCKNEYENPSDRRFHAQPIACNSCGSAVTLMDNNRQVIAEKHRALELAAEALKRGQIVAVKALGGFQLCCDASNETAVKLLRERKQRPHKPLAVLFANIESIKQQTEINSAEQTLITAHSAAIVLVQKNSNYSLAENVAPYIDRLGVMLPSSPIQYILMNLINIPIVATSANISDEPVIIDDQQLYEKLSEVFDVVLTHNRDIINACDDSVLQIVNNTQMQIRRARGFAPQALVLPHKLLRPTLALGAQQKSTIALGFDRSAVLSQHIGDLFSLSSMEFFERTIAAYKRLYKFEPQEIVCDLHPAYASVKWAQTQPLPHFAVQHHHAHALAVMAEFALKEDVLALAWDGTGYGTDGTIWGGEFLLANYREFTRVAHIKPFRLIGGEQAIKHPKRLAFALLHDAQIDHPLLRDHDAHNFAALIANGTTAPLCSSIGRLFDAVAYLAEIEREYTFDGASGLKIEALYDDTIRGHYPFEIADGVIDFAPMFQAIFSDKPQVIASKFINTLTVIALEIAAPYDLPIVLCGGVWQNKTLASRVKNALTQSGKRVFLPSLFPPNDGAIALGQLASRFI
ncbi:carbamoyltransferase [Campylobacterota bacterium]|nr:carbamoyltransferase [Campylobacterota bacterium]